MESYPTLKQPPILLSILEIKFSSESPIRDFDKKHLFKKLESYFTDINELKSVGIQIDPQNEVRIDRTTTNAFDYTNKEKGYQLKVSPNSFTFRKIRGYKNWEDFINPIREIWSVFTREIKGVLVNRISLRYINNIFIDLGEIPLSEISNSFIQSPDDLSRKEVSSFHFKLTYPNKTPHEPLVHYQQEMEPSINETERKYKIVIDIDVLKHNEYSVSQDQQMWKDFEDLRMLKNEFFFKNLGKKLIEHLG